MTRLTVDPVMKEKLTSAGHRVEVCDEAGCTIGYFMPAYKVPSEVLEWAKHEITDEEIQQSLSEPGGCTTEELIAQLKQS